MKKIFIPTPLDEIIELPKDVTHHVLHVFRHNMEKPITVTGSDNRCGIYQITDEVDGIAQAKLIEYVASDVSSNYSSSILIERRKVRMGITKGDGVKCRYHLSCIYGKLCS